MRFAGPYFAAVALLISAIARSQDSSAVDAADANKPYETIVARNMFGLLPIPPPDTNPPAPPVDPPPKITLNGIMTIFGRDQALYKVATKPKPGQPAKEDSYVLGENERQDDIEVVKINRESNVVTFNNHGTQQEVQLAEASSGGSAPGPGGGGNPGMPANLRPGAMSAADRAALFRTYGNGRGAANQTPQSPQTPQGANNPGMGIGNGAMANTAGPQTDPSITPEQAAYLIEAQRIKYLQQNSPIANLLPPTAFTKQVLQENTPGGNGPGGR
jgi:hypothetical protein